MKSLLWKRLNEIKKQKGKLIILLAFPAVYLVVLHVLKIKADAIIAFFGLSVTLVSTIAHFSVEELVASEVLLATNISIRKVWFANALFISVVGYIYSTILIVIFVISYRLISHGPTAFGGAAVVIHLFSIFISIAFIGASTVHFADYSKSKQLVASFFSIVSISSPFLVIAFGNRVQYNLYLVAGASLLAAALFMMSYGIVSRADKEKLMINTQMIVRAYEGKMVEE